MEFRDLSAEDAARWIDEESDLVVLDVRTPPEYAMHRIDGATLLPVQELTQRFGELDPSRKHLVVCEHGVRSLAACEFLQSQGFDALANLQGGMARWLAAGLPHTRS